MLKRTVRKSLNDNFCFSVVGGQVLSSTTGEWPTESAMMMILMGARLMGGDRPPLLLLGGAQPLLTDPCQIGALCQFSPDWSHGMS